jgi:hypothetical protein
MTTNCCLEEAISLLLNGGLRKTTNQIMLMEYGYDSFSLVLARLIGLRNLNPDCQSLMSPTC